MDKTIGKAALFLFWVLSMTWLVTTKIWPDLGPTTLPDVAYFDAASPSQEVSTRWDVYTNGRRIGRAETIATRAEDGTAQVNSTLHVDRISLDRLVHQMFGSWGRLIRWVETMPTDLEISFDAETNMTLDRDGQLETFIVHVSTDDVPELFIVEGTRQGARLAVRVASRSANNEPAIELLRTSFTLPENGLAADVFSPHPRLANLRKGQKWRFETYQAFPPGRSLRLTEATVQREELILWQGDVETVFVVAYRDISHKGPTASAHPYSHLWVRDDGTVLKQQITISSLQLEFHRLPNRQGDGPAP